MTSSLIFGPFDLLDPASPVRLLMGWERGAPAPTVSQIVSTVLDGSAVTGRSAGNRQISLPLYVEATDRLSMAGLTNQVLQLVDQPSWTLTWTPDGGLPVVFDCYRAAALLTSDETVEALFTQTLQVSCDALPYGRSPNPVMVTATGAVSQLLDGFESAVPSVSASLGSVGTPTLVTSPAPAQGAKALRVPVTYVTSSKKSSGDYSLSRTGLSIVTTSDTGSAQISMRIPSALLASSTSVKLTLTTSSGTFTGTKFGPPLYANSWAIVAATFSTPIPAGSTITGWTVRVAVVATPSSSAPAVFYFDQLQVNPPNAVGVSDARGAVYALSGVTGTARTPVALQLSASAGGNFKSWCVYTPPEDVPAQPLIPLGGASSLVTVAVAAPVKYQGTYSLWISLGTVNSPNTPRQISVAASTSTGTSSAIASLLVSIVPTASNALYYLGEITLPGAAVPDECFPSTSFQVVDYNTSDVMNDLLVLDTRGQTVIVDSTATSRKYAWADAPAPTVAFGGVYTGTVVDRSDALGVGGALVAASTLLVNPGDSPILAFSPDSASLLTITATYYPRWLQEATS